MKYLSVLLFFSCISVFAQRPAHHEVYQEFEVVKNAEFPGGMEAFRKIVTENLVYPEKAKQKKIEGKSVISFLIDTNGNLTEPRVVKRLGEGCDEAAINAILTTKHIKWSPAINTEGKVVKVRKNFPVTFKLPKTE